MAWKISSVGKVTGTFNEQNSYAVMTETVTLGGTADSVRYSSAFSLPRGAGVTVISNTSSTNTSDSISDWLYVSWDNSTFVQHSKLRDCNYADDTNKGTTTVDLDNTVKQRYIDTDYTGEFPYMKIGLIQGGVESTGMTIGLALTLGKLEKGAFANASS